MFKPLNSRINQAQRPLFEALEPRWLLSADLPGLAIPIDGTQVTATPAEHAPSFPAAPRHEIAFIDGGLPDAQALAADMAEDTPERHLEVVVIDPTADGFEQVSAELAKRRGLDAIHLIGHGTEGTISLGTSLLDAAEASRRAATLVRWHNALKPDADILLYGCRTAYGIDGDRLLQTLADLTGADVAGSVDATGARDLGGNWVLERQTGKVEAALALSLRFQQSYSALLDGAAGGTEARVNSSTANTQTIPATAQKQVAVAADGSYVVVWASDHASSGNYEIYARRFNADGSAATGEIQVNQTTTGVQTYPTVACDASGNFVVMWQGPDANSTGTFARRFSAAGTALANEFQVNTTTSGEQREGAIAMAADGRFVIGWSSENGQDGSGVGAYFRLYNAAGTAQTGEVRVNTVDGRQPVHGQHRHDLERQLHRRRHRRERRRHRIRRVLPPLRQQRHRARREPAGGQHHHCRRPDLRVDRDRARRPLHRHLEQRRPGRQWRRASTRNASTPTAAGSAPSSAPTARPRATSTTPPSRWIAMPASWSPGTASGRTRPAPPASIAASSTGTEARTDPRRASTPPRQAIRAMPRWR